LTTEQRQSVSIPLGVLRKQPILDLLSEQELARALSAARLVQFQKRATVLLKGQALDHLAILLSGKLQVIDHLPNGQEIGLSIIQPGNFFGELAVIDRRPRSATLIALLPATVIQIPGDVARKLFFEHPRVAERMMTHFAQMIRRSNELRALLALPNAFQRVFALLDSMKERQADGTLIINDLPTHQELASMANTSRETVTRALSLSAANGILQKQGRQLQISNPAALQRLANGAGLPALQPRSRAEADHL
jgi:CRP-like cAMP-binding protein